MTMVAASVRSCLFVLVVVLLECGNAKHISMLDIQEFVDQLGDEIMSHKSLRNPNGNYLDSKIHELTSNSYMSNEKDDVPHPVSIYNWGTHAKLGQVTGVAINPNDEPVILHRGNTVWNKNSFDPYSNTLVNRTPIANDTIVTLNPESGEIMSSWGSGQFYMPHGLDIDDYGNVYVTDVGTHQVYRFPAGKTIPDLVLGVKFEPGSDEQHFCKPTDVAVAMGGNVFFVADGYCNSRIMKFSFDGKLLQVINGDWKLPHSLALFEDEDVICVADREGGQVECFRAGLRQPKFNDRDETGTSVVRYDNVGRPYAIASKGTALLVVSGQPDVKGITIDTASDATNILDQWGIEELSEPHDISISKDGEVIYVVESDVYNKNKLHKFEVVRSNTMF